jgi:hypothetical protein
MEAHKKENCSFRGTTLPQSKISEIKKLYHFGLNFSDVSKQTGISSPSPCTQVWDKYFSDGTF